MKHTSHEDIVKRLKRANGHLRSTIDMIEAERDCLDVAQQLFAVEKAIIQAKKLFIQDHIDHCLQDAADPGDGDIKSPAELVDEFRQLSKYL